ncbi:MAG TPA: SRPBCC family protein [Solirubrobacterales bacterium]|nr:SRPBCC family protein [Solirubrobacterales bacterium]
MPGKHATLEEIDGRPALRFERVLAHPPERVWRALTDTDEMFTWHPTPARFEPRVGGRVDWHPDGHVADMPDNEVTDWDPPRLLGYTWAKEGERPDHLRWELRPHDDGCVLILVHTFDDRLKAARDGAGWHVCLDALAEEMDGGAPEPPGGDPDVPGPWTALNDEYQGRFGISPEEATPPPTRH